MLQGVANKKKKADAKQRKGREKPNVAVGTWPKVDGGKWNYSQLRNVMI